MKTIDVLLSQLVIGSRQNLADLTVYPVLGKPDTEIDLIGLEEAIESGAAQVTEVSSSGSVPELKVTNRSSRGLIIFDGEELIGAKQNRIVNVTVIVPASCTLIIPVSCIEQGRWRYSSNHFSTGDFVSPSLRREKFLQVSESELRSGSLAGDQGMVWEEIAQKSARMGVHSQTGSFRDLAETYRADDEKLRYHFPILPDQVGYFAFIREGFAGGDIFATHELAARRFYKLLRSYHLDALDRGAEFPGNSLSQVIEDIAKSPTRDFETVGAGRELRFQSERTQGSITYYGDRLAHLTAFPKVESERRHRDRQPRWIY